MIKTANTEHEFKDIVMADLKSHNILTQKAILKSTLNYWSGDAQCSNSGNTEIISYKAVITFMVFEEETTINKIKGIAKYRPLHPQFKAIKAFWCDDNTIVYSYDSWYHTYEEHNPSPYNGFPKVWGWSDDDVKTMPDVWADSHPSSKLAHYKPWPCCYYGPNYSITGDQWTKVELHGLKFYKDIDDLNKIYQFERDEIIRLIPVAENMNKQYAQFLTTVDWHKKSDRKIIRQYKLKLNQQNVNLNKVKMDF